MPTPTAAARMSQIWRRARPSCGSACWRPPTATPPPTARSPGPPTCPARTDALAAAADPPLEIAECAAEAAEAAAEVAAGAGTWAFGADAVVASELAAAAARGAALLVSANLGSASDDPRLARAREAAERAERSVPDRDRKR